MGQDGPVEPVGTDGVGVEQPGDVLGGEGLDVPDEQVPGVVDDDVEPARFVQDGSDCGVGGVLGGDVELDDAQVDALVFRGVQQTLGARGVAAAGVAHAGVDGVAVGGEGAGGQVADAGTGACNEDDGHDGSLGWRRRPGWRSRNGPGGWAEGEPGQAIPPLA